MRKLNSKVLDFTPPKIRFQPQLHPYCNINLIPKVLCEPKETQALSFIGPFSSINGSMKTKYNMIAFTYDMVDKYIL